MVERGRRNLSLLDQGEPLMDHIDGVTSSETYHHPKPTSKRGQIIEMLEAWGYEAHPLELARLLGITEVEMKRFTSRRGVRSEEYEKMQERFEATLTIARITKDLHPEGPFAFVDRRAMLSAQHPQFADEITGKPRSAFELMRNGESYKVISVLGNSIEFQRDHHFDE